MKNTVFQIRISDADKEKLKYLAKTNQMSMAEYLIDRIRREYEKQKEK